MGTDIHFYVEAKDETGIWRSCDKWSDNEYDEKAKNKTVKYGDHFYNDRNYDLFAILADVRNGRGFAGVDTGNGFIPLCQPRGLPEDMSPELATEASTNMEHTPSWLTVKELMDYDWTRVTKKRGVVTADQYADWCRWRKGRGLGPDEYCGGVSGVSVQHITEEQMANRISAIKDQKPEDLSAELKKEMPHVYCSVSWESPYYRAADTFLFETLPRMWRLGEPQNVRCVFWFDS